jgi:O-antigen biosynthesis protein
LKNSSSITVSIIIPNYNGKKLLQENLPQFIKAKKHKENHIAEIIVVDDGSTDDSAPFIKKNYPSVRLIKHKANRGFSAAVNMGARLATSELLAIINTDVNPTQKFLQNVVPHFIESEVFGVSLHETGYGPSINYFNDGYIQQKSGKETTKAVYCLHVSGGSGVFRKKIWTELGGLDEKLLSPFYWEDFDICYRAAKRGYKLLWEPGSKVEHRHESTIGTLPKKYVDRVKERNQLLVVWKNITSLNLTKKHVAGIVRRLVHHPGYIKIVIMALGKISLVLQRRKRERHESSVSDEAIFAKYG